MASNRWVPVYGSLRDHPKLIDLCDRLSIEPAEGIGALVLLWTWAMDYAPDGDLTRFRAAQLARAA